MALNWNDLKIFLEVADAPSMRAAAKKLGVSHSKISRRIDALEKDLNVALFSRTPEGYVLTKAGQELLPVALQTDETLHTFGRNIAGRDTALEGQVCVTIPDNSTSNLFLPYFLEFMELHPSIQIKVSESYKLFDLSKREADVALRVTNNPPDHLIGRKLGTLAQAAYATKDYVAKHRPEAQETTAKWVAWGQPEERPGWIKNTPFPHLGIMGHFNNPQIQLEVTRCGGGIGFFPCFLGDSDPSLVRLSEPTPTFELWMLWHRDMRAAARLRAFREFIVRNLPDIRAQLEGKMRPLG